MGLSGSTGQDNPLGLVGWGEYVIPLGLVGCGEEHIPVGLSGCTRKDIPLGLAGWGEYVIPLGLVGCGDDPTGLSGCTRNDIPLGLSGWGDEQTPVGLMGCTRQGTPRGESRGERNRAPLRVASPKDLNPATRTVPTGSAHPASKHSMTMDMHTGRSRSLRSLRTSITWLGGGEEGGEG